MTRAELIKALLDDFIKSSPESTRVERVEVFSRLDGLDIQDLMLLTKNLPTKAVPIE